MYIYSDVVILIPLSHTFKYPEKSTVKVCKLVFSYFSRKYSHLKTQQVVSMLYVSVTPVITHLSYLCDLGIIVINKKDKKRTLEFFLKQAIVVSLDTNVEHIGSLANDNQQHVRNEGNGNKQEQITLTQVNKDKKFGCRDRWSCLAGEASSWSSSANAFNVRCCLNFE